MLNIKNLILAIFLLGTCVITIEPTEASAQTSACTFTYEQVYSVGANLARAETFYNEYFQLYKNTLRDFSHCHAYVAGVKEGYLKNRKTFVGPGEVRGDVTYPCFPGSVCPPGAGDADE